MVKIKVMSLQQSSTTMGIREFIKEFYATMYTDEDLNVHSFDLHDGDDYVEFDEELEDSLLEFFQEVGDKIKQSMI